MDRFTQPGFDPCANCGERSHCEHITDPDFTILCGEAEMYKRLSAYEETGLEPRDILNATDMAKVACALHELNKYKELGDLDHLRELVEADREEDDLKNRALYRLAISTYGPEAQTLMVFEEMAELQKELCKHARGTDNREAIAEEIADVQIMLEQMIELHGCADAVLCYKRHKLERLAERIEHLKGEQDG